MNNNYFKKAEDFFNRGRKEYEEGFKERDMVKIREGCEKIFHSFVELSNAIFKDHGIPIPEDHVTRSELLQQFKMHMTYDFAKERLHNTCYYSGIIKKNYLDIAIDAVETEIKKRK
ncbi:MAG TPA: hypothetical protein EYP22_03570 [Methanosarcinales archaeon]|nr:hypothetical protein [Methanosarcinales archaeon]